MSFFLSRLCICAQIAILGGLLSACETQLKQQTIDDITLCNAGSEISVSGKLAADLGKVVESGQGSIEAELKKEIVGTFANSSDLTEENKLAAYDKYAECMISLRKERKEKIQNQTCIDGCNRQYTARIESLETNFNGCMAKRPSACVRECIEKYGIDGHRCANELCDPEKQRNIDSWTMKCRIPKTPAERDLKQCKSDCYG